MSDASEALKGRNPRRSLASPGGASAFSVVFVEFAAISSKPRCLPEVTQIRSSLPGWIRRNVWLVLPVIWLAAMVLFYPFRFVFEFDIDEGVHLIEALMQARGQALYDDVFIDHPPLLPYGLSWLVRWFGNSVTIGRVSILLISTALMTSSAFLLKEAWGTAHSVAASFLLAVLPYYSQLSVSVMTGLPAIALAVGGLVAFALWKRSKHWWWLSISAAALGLSVMTKLFTVWLAMVLLVYLVAEGAGRITKGESVATALRPALLLGGEFLIVVAGFLVFLVGLENLPQLLRLHARAAEVQFFTQRAQSLNINTYLGATWGILGLAIMGSILAIRSRGWAGWVLAGWLGASYTFLFFTIPVWYHHQLLITVPAALLAAVFIGECARGVWAELGKARVDRVRLLMAASGLAISLVVTASRIPPFLSNFQPALPNLRPGESLGGREFEVLAIMSDYADETDLLVTDRPMFAFRLGVSVPPELAMFSEKRLLADPSFRGQVLAVLREVNPEQVLLARFSLPEIERRLNDGYERVYVYQNYRLYIRQDLVQTDPNEKRARAQEPVSEPPTMEDKLPPW